MVDEEFEAANVLSALAEMEEMPLKEAKASSASVKQTSKPDVRTSETNRRMRYLQMMNVLNSERMNQITDWNSNSIPDKHIFTRKNVSDALKGKQHNIPMEKKFQRKRIVSRKNNRISLNEREKYYEDLIIQQDLESAHQHIARENLRSWTKNRFNGIFIAEPSHPITNSLQLSTSRRQREIDSSRISNNTPIDYSLGMKAPRTHREIDSSRISNKIPIGNLNLRMKTPRMHRENDASPYLNSIRDDNNHLRMSISRLHGEIASLSNCIPIGNYNREMNIPRTHGEIVSPPLSNNMTIDNTLLLNKLGYSSDIDSSRFSNRMPIGNTSLRMENLGRHSENDFSRLSKSMPSYTNSHRLNRQRRRSKNDFSRLLNSMTFVNHALRLSQPKINREIGSTRLSNSINRHEKIVNHSLTLNTAKHDGGLDNSKPSYKSDRNDKVITGSRRMLTPRRSAVSDSGQTSIPTFSALSNKISRDLIVNDSQQASRHSAFHSSGSSQEMMFQDKIIEDALNVLNNEKQGKELRRIQGVYREKRAARSSVIQNWLSNSK